LINVKLFNFVIVFLSRSLTVGVQSEGLYRISGFSDLIEDVKLAFDRGRALFPLPLYRILLSGWGSQWVSIGLRPRTIVDIAARLRGLGWTKTDLIGNGSYQVRPIECQLRL
jgi:hypothetical protein